MTRTRDMTEAKLQDLPPGDIELYDNVLPPLPAGDFQLSVTQDAHGDGVSASYPHDQRIRVAGPHLGLGPNDVFSVYPPSGSTADYTESLAHVVLTKRNLPWEISVDSVTSGPCVVPWLALLLLTPEEIVLPSAGKANAAGAHTIPLPQYLEPPAHIAGPSLSADQKRELEEENPPDVSFSVVDVKADAFSAIAPTKSELTYLAHSRQVDTGDQEILGIDADGWFSVVFGNRLCQKSATGIYAAHLVSIEGFVDRLPPATLTGVDAVRLISLASWTFNGLESAGDFAGLMKNLNVGMLEMPELVPNPTTPDEQLVKDALAGGYTALAYRTRLGEETVGWYRGPCLPVQMEANPQPAFQSAEAALVYDSRTGMFDVSFAVASQAGRLSTLANRNVVVALLQWLRHHHGLSHLLEERLTLATSLEDVVEPDDVSALLEPELMRRVAGQWLTTSVAPNLVEGPGSVPAWGPSRDASGLRRHLARLPGLVSPDAFDALLARTTDVSSALVDALRGSLEDGRS